MIRRGHDDALNLRALAARLRGHAAETAVELYRQKFETAAIHLEQAAEDAEREQHRPDLKQVS